MIPFLLTLFPITLFGKGIQPASQLKHFNYQISKSKIILFLGSHLLEKPADSFVSQGFVFENTHLHTTYLHYCLSQTVCRAQCVRFLSIFIKRHHDLCTIRQMDVFVWKWRREQKRIRTRKSNCQNKCCHCRFLQIVDMLKLYLI